MQCTVWISPSSTAPRVNRKTCDPFFLSVNSIPPFRKATDQPLPLALVAIFCAIARRVLSSRLVDRMTTMSISPPARLSVRGSESPLSR